MSKISDQLLILTTNFAKSAVESLEVTAKEKGKFPFWLKKKDKNKAEDKKKLDPSAAVRNRGDVCVPAEHAKNKQDHFPINNIDQARNALSQVAKYTVVPPWFNGTLKGLQALVSRKVHSKYPSIGKADKKASLEAMINKYGQEGILDKIKNFVHPTDAQHDQEIIDTLNKARAIGEQALQKLDQSNSPLKEEGDNLKKIFDDFLSKLNQESKSIKKASLESLFNKYAQQEPQGYAPVVKRPADSTYNNWSAKQLAGLGDYLLETLHQQGKITKDQYDSANTILKTPVTPQTPAVKPIVQVPQIKPAVHDKKWWETPILDKERMDPFTGKPYEKPVAKQGILISNEIFNKYG